MTKEERLPTDQQVANAYSPLWDLMSSNHERDLLISEMDDIIHAGDKVKKSMDILYGVEPEKLYSSYQVEEKTKELVLLFESLTPGGSEFYNDPKACAAYIKETVQSIPKTILGFKKRAEEVEERSRGLLEALENLMEQYRFVVTDNSIVSFDRQLSEGLFPTYAKAKETLNTYNNSKTK